LSSPRGGAVATVGTRVSIFTITTSCGTKESPNASSPEGTRIVVGFVVGATDVFSAASWRIAAAASRSNVGILGTSSTGSLGTSSNQEITTLNPPYLGNPLVFRRSVREEYENLYICLPQVQNNEYF